LSFFNRLGDLAKDIGEAAYAAPKFVWDVTTAPWNDAEEFNGFKNTLVNAGGQALQRVIAPVANVASLPAVKPVLQKWDEINREYIREPLTSAVLMAKDAENPLSGSAWKEAHDQAQTTSFGQAVVGGIAALTPGQQEAETIDWTNPNAVNQYFNHGAQKFWSGIGDVAIQAFGDVAIGAGVARKAATGSELISNSLTGLTASQSAARLGKAIELTTLAGDGLEAGKYNGLLEDLAKNDALWAYNHPMLKDSPARATLAHAFGQAQNVKDASLVMRAGLGDLKALEDIRAVGRYDLANPIAKSQGQLDKVDEFNLKAPRNQDGSFKNINEDDAVHAEIAQEVDALSQHSESFTKFLDDSLNKDQLGDLAQTGGGSLKRTTGASPFRAVDKFIAEGRTAKFYDMKSTDVPNVDVFQPTVFHRMYQVVSWPAGERPSGHINLNDSESSREISAVLQRASKRGAIQGDSAARIMDSYLAASTPESRAEVVYDMERFILTGLAEKRGLDVDTAQKVYDNYKRTRATALSSLREKGYAVDVDGSVFKVPVLESETVNSLPIMDFDLADGIFQKHNLLGDNQSLYNKALGHVVQGADDTVNVFDTMQSLFKIGALLRLGYMVRNSLEAQLRISSSVGSMAAMRQVPGGLKNLVYNTGNTAKRAVDRFIPGSKDFEFYKTQNETLGTEIEDITSRIENIQRKIENDRGLHNSGYPTKKHPTSGKLVPDRSKPKTAVDPDSFVVNPDHEASLNQLNKLLSEKQEAQALTNKAMSNLETKKLRMGSGTFKYTTSDGIDYEVPEAFNQSYFGDIHWNNSSSESSYMALADTDAKFLSRKMVHTGYGEVTPQDPHYWGEWATTLNRRFANSEVIRRLANNENPYDIISWLRSPEGKGLRDRLGLDKREADSYVHTANGLFQKYIPDQELRQMIVNREQITPELLRSKFTETSKLPTVNGHVIEENLNLVGQRKAQGIVTGLFKMLGSMPEDAWARHPLYIDLYKKSLKSRIESFNKVNGRPMEGMADDVVASKELQIAMRAAHADALMGTKKVLFTIDRRSNLSTYMRFISPFFSAYENSVKTWAKLAYDKPQIINRANLLFTAPNRAGIATDANGNPVDAENATMDDYIWIEVPESMKRLPFVGKGLQSLTEMGVQKRSLDVVFQGDTNIPIGPYVAIPVSEIVKAQPTYEQSLKWAIPFGAERNAATAMLPSWVKKQITKSQGQNDPQYANTYTLIWQTEQQKRKEKGLTPATADEIKKMADAYWNMRTVANLVLPFAPQFQTPYKMYIDKWRQYKESYGVEANTKFWQDYGDDMYQFTMSLSKNNTGASATVSSVQNAQKYKELVSQVGDIDPKLIALITETGNGAYQFSDAAYKWQQRNAISANSTTTFRGVNDPAQAVKDNNASLGWLKYRNTMNVIDAAMQQRGLKNLNVKAAEDLMNLKKATVAKLADENKDWYKDYKDTDGSKFIRVRESFAAILNDKKFMADHGNDPTWKSVRMYLDTQAIVEQALRARKAAGGAQTISAKANEDLNNLLVETANRLKQEDIGFGDLYDRYLSYDPVFDPNLPGSEQ
jgi:hypothetical protein